MKGTKKRDLTSDSLVTHDSTQSGSVSAAIQVLQHYSRGLALVNNGNNVKAIKAFTRAIEDSPTPTDIVLNALTQRARCYLFCFLYDECISDCNSILSMNPKDRNALELLNEARSHASANASTAETVDVTLVSESSATNEYESACSRCKAIVGPDANFCALCGEPCFKRKSKQSKRKAKAKSTSAVPKNSIDLSASTVMDDSTSYQPVMPFESQLMSLLSAPVVSREQEEMTRQAWLRTSQLEMDNALLMESSSLSMLRDLHRPSSITLSTTTGGGVGGSLSLSVEESKYSLPAIRDARHQRSGKRQKIRNDLGSHRSIASSRSAVLPRKHQQQPPVLIDNYLEEVGSIRDQFARYVSRTYEYQGIRSIVRERLAPLEKRPVNELEFKHHVEGEFFDTIRPLSKLVNRPLDDPLLHQKQKNGDWEEEDEPPALESEKGFDLEEGSSSVIAATAGATVASTTAEREDQQQHEGDELEEETLNEGIDYQPQSLHEGSAFLWGPLFDNTADFTAGGSMEVVRQKDDELKQYSLRGDYSVSAEDPVFRKETEAEKREADADSRDIFFWGDLMNENKPAHASEPVLEPGETAAHFDEEYLVSRLLRWNQGYMDSYTPPDTESDSESEDEEIDLTVNDPATLTDRYEQQQKDVNALTSDQMTLQRDLPRVTWDDLSIVEDLEDRLAADREEYAAKDESLIMAVKNDVIAINEARDAVFLSRQSKMERFERQMKRDIRHAKRKLRKFERQRWKETMKTSTQLYIDSVLHSGVVGGDPSLLATLPEPVPHEAIFELMEDHDDLVAVGEDSAQRPLREGSVSSLMTLGESFSISSAALTRQSSLAALAPAGLSSEFTNSSATDELVSKQMLRLADKLTHTNDEPLLIKIENTRKHNRIVEEQQDLVKVHVEDQVELKLVQNERELTEMQRRVDMLNIEKLIDSDRLVEHSDKLDEVGLKDLSDEIQRQIKKQTADQLELTSKPHNLTDDEAYIYNIESNMLNIRLLTETLDYQHTIMDMQVRMNNNQRDRDIHELTRKIGAIRAENVVKLETFTRMVEEREAKKAEEKRKRDLEEYQESVEVNTAKKAERKKNRRRRKQQQQTAGGADGVNGDDDLSRPGTAATDSAYDASTSANTPRSVMTSQHSEGLLTGRTDDDDDDDDGSYAGEGAAVANDYEAVHAELQIEEAKPSIFLDETTDMMRVEYLESNQVNKRNADEDADVDSIVKMQQNLNQFEHSREAIGIQRSQAGEYFDVGQKDAPLSEMDILMKKLQEKNQKELSAELSTLDIIQAPDLIELMDAQIVAIKKSVETLDTDVINHTFNQFNHLQSYRDLTEKHKLQIREVEEGLLESLPVDEDGLLKPPTDDDLQELGNALMPLSMIRDVAEIVKREMAQLMARNEAEEQDDQSMVSLQEGLSSYNRSRMDTELARHSALADIDDGFISQEPEKPATPPPAERKVLTVEELSALYGADDSRQLSEEEIADRAKQVEISELKMSEAGALVQDIESSHSTHRNTRSMADAEFLFLQQDDILKTRTESEAVEKHRRIEAVELEQALVIGNPSAFAGQSNTELASLHIARDAVKLELLEKTLVFKRTIEEARDDVTLASNLTVQLEGLQSRNALHHKREEHLEVLEQDVEAENAMIAERIEAQSKMKKKNKLKEAILYQSTLVDPNIIADEKLEYTLETSVRNLIVTDELSLEMKVEHAEIIQKSQDELADQHRIDQLLKDFDQMQVKFDDQAYQRQIHVEQLYEEAGILMLGEEAEEEAPPAAEGEGAGAAVAEEQQVKPYISRRRQRREEALRNRVIPDKITVEVKTITAPVEELEERERLVVVTEAELERYKTRRRAQLHVRNNLMAIKRLYSDSYNRLQRAVEEMEIDFKVNPKQDLTTSTKTLVALTRNKLMSTYDTLEDATKVNTLVNAEYGLFQEYLNQKRTQSTLDLSEAMVKTSQLEQAFREKYAAAAREFKAAADANEFSFVSATGKHITSSKQMDAIKLEAEKSLAKQGMVVKALQAKEAQLVLNIKQEEFVVQEIIKKWHPRHCEMIDKTSLAYRRLEGWLRDNIAGKK